MNKIKKIYFVLGFVLIFSVLESYAIIREKVPVYEVGEDFSLHQLLDYAIQRTDSVPLRIKNEYNAYTLYISYEDEERIKIVITMCDAQLLLYGKYIGFFSYDSHDFFICDCPKKLFEMFFYNAKLLKEKRMISMDSGPVLDGVGPEWVFVIDDSKVYLKRYLWKDGSPVYPY